MPKFNFYTENEVNHIKGYLATPKLQRMTIRELAVEMGREPGGLGAKVNAVRREIEGRPKTGGYKKKTKRVYQRRSLLNPSVVKTTKISIPFVGIGINLNAMALEFEVPLP